MAGTPTCLLYIVAMLSTHDLKVRLESTLASLESDTKHVENEIHLLNQKIDTSLQVRSEEWVAVEVKKEKVHF